MDRVAAHADALEMRAVLVQLERAIGRQPAAVGAGQTTWAENAARWLRKQAPGRAWAELVTAREPGSLLTDRAIPLPARRRLHRAAGVFENLDLLIQRAGGAPVFLAAAVRAPWAVELSARGKRSDSLTKLAGTPEPPGIGWTCVHRNSEDGAWYRFADLGVAQEEHPIDVMSTGGRGKLEDVPRPRLVVPEGTRAMTFWALTRYAHAPRSFELDLQPLRPADGDLQVRRLVLRGIATGQNRAIVGMRVTAELVPPGEYSVRVHAFRVVGVENQGMQLFELYMRTEGPGAP